MEFNGFTYFSVTPGAITDNRIPEMYQEFVPGNQAKTKNDYPYSYDPFLIYFNEKAKAKASGTIYADRMLHQDWDRHNELCRKHFGNEGQMWNNRPADKIQAFLSDWVGRPVILIANIQYCNVSNGYPHWRFDIADAVIPEK